MIATRLRLVAINHNPYKNTQKSLSKQNALVLHYLIALATQIEQAGLLSPSLLFLLLSILLVLIVVVAVVVVAAAVA